MKINLPSFFFLIGVTLYGTQAASIEVNEIRRVSVASDGSQAISSDRGSGNAAISPDGRFVAFLSGADNLVPNDTNGEMDAFMHDIVTGQTRRVSIASDGAEADSLSEGVSVAAEGQYVAFNSPASNLVSEDTNGTLDVFVHELSSRVTTRVSISSNGTQGDRRSRLCAITPDGRFVLFHSRANNLVPDDTNSGEDDDVFVHDRLTSETMLVNVTANGDQIMGNNRCNAINPDGTLILFVSNANSLGPGDGISHLYIKNLSTGDIDMVSVASDGTPNNEIALTGGRVGLIDSASISDDGRFVVFAAASDNLVPNDTNGEVDIFLHDRATKGTRRISEAANGDAANETSRHPSISGDGTRIGFDSMATNLTGDSFNGESQAFVQERESRETSVISRSSSGILGNLAIVGVSLSLDGCQAAFGGHASNLVPDDTNGIKDVFVVSLGGECPALPSASGVKVAIIAILTVLLDDSAD